MDFPLEIPFQGYVSAGYPFDRNQTATMMVRGEPDYRKQKASSVDLWWRQMPDETLTTEDQIQKYLAKFLW